MGKIAVIGVIAVFLILKSHTSKPGYYFWKAKFAIDRRSFDNSTSSLHSPTKENVRDGYVVLVEGYKLGISLVGIIVGIQDRESRPRVADITSASFYTNLYRWGLRHLSLLPSWINGYRNYWETHKVWYKRYHYNNEFVPHWARYLIPTVTNKEWEREERENLLFQKHALIAFGKHYTYPVERPKTLRINE